GPTGDGDAVDVGHGHEGVGVADPDGGGELGHVADEPGVGVVLGGARLARHGAADGGAGAGAVVDDALEAGVEYARLLVDEGGVGLRRVLVDQLAVAVLDAHDAIGLGVDAL